MKIILCGINESKKKTSGEPMMMAARMYSTLAAYYISEGLLLQQSLSASDLRKSTELFDEANLCLNDSEKRNSADECFGVRKGK